MNLDTDAMESVLKDFYQKMSEWESAVAKLKQLKREEVLSSEDYKKQFMESYMKVFKRFCCRTAEARGYRLSGRPEYDPSRLEILRSSIDGQEGEVVVKAELDYERVFKMVLENGQWKIKEKYMIGFKDGSQVSESL